MFKHIPYPLRALLALSSLISLAIFFNLWQPLRGDYGWRWPHSLPERLDQWLPSTLAIVVYIGGAFWLMRQPSRPLWQVIGWALLGCVLLPIIFLARWGDPLYHQFVRVADGGVSGPHRIAMSYSSDELDDKLKHWTDEQQRFAADHISIHAALAPPALPLMYFFTGQFLEHLPLIADPLGREFRTLQCQNLELAQNDNAELASASLGMLSPLWASLAIFPLLSLGRGLLDETGARWAVLLWGLLPGVAIFTPVPNTVFPTFALLCLWLLWQGLEKRSYAYVLGAGLVMGVLSFFNFSLVPLILLCGWLTLGYHVLIANRSEQPPRRSWSIEMGLAYGLGLVLVWIIWLLYGGEPPWQMLQTAMSQHLELDRPYLPWLVLHLWDYGLFIGLPVFFVSLWGIWQAVGTRKNVTPAALVALAWAISMLLLDLSGTARGETGRVWQFFFPVTLLIALAALRGLPSVNYRALVVTQGLAAWVMVLVIGAVGSGLKVPPQAPPQVENPQITATTDLRFGDTFRLTGFGGHLDDHNDLVVDLRWHADQSSEQPYYFAIIPVAPDGQAYQDGFVYQPFEAQYPATCWQPGQEIIERVTIPLEGQPPVGDWWLSLSILDYHTSEPLTVTLPDGSTDQQAGIGAIRVE